MTVKFDSNFNYLQMYQLELKNIQNQISDKYKNILKSDFQSHAYHMVDPSPWPICVSFSLLALTIGAVVTMQGYPQGSYLFAIGFASTTGGIFLWLRDVANEGTFLGHHTKKVQGSLSLGMILFIISEIFVFLSVFWAFYHNSLSPSVEIGGIWPPQGITPLDPFAIPLLNTGLLLTSGATVTYGHHALVSKDRKGAIDGTFLTVLLSIIFTSLQYVEYRDAAFTFADSVFATVFYASTGLHGLHVIVGAIFILTGLGRIVSYSLTNTHHQGHEAGILYWHFVDVVWIYLFLTVYYWGGLGS